MAINGSQGFYINGSKQIVWVGCEDDLVLYYNSSTVYSVYNATDKVPMDVVYGDGTSYLSEAVWDYTNTKSIGAWFFDNSANTTVTDHAGYNNLSFNSGDANITIGDYGYQWECYDDTKYFTKNSGVVGTPSGSGEWTVYIWMLTSELNSNAGTPFAYGGTAANDKEFRLMYHCAGNYTCINTYGEDGQTLPRETPGDEIFFLSAYKYDGSDKYNAVNSSVDDSATRALNLDDNVIRMGEWSYGTTWSRFWGKMAFTLFYNESKSEAYRNQTYFNILGDDGYGSLGAQTANTTIPVVNNTVLTPSSPYSDDDLNCSFDIWDADSSVLNITAEWYVEGSLEHTDTWTNQAQGSSLSTLLLSGNISADDEVSCNITATDSDSNTGTDDVSTTVNRYDAPEVYIVTPANHSTTVNLSNTVTFVCNNSVFATMDSYLYINDTLMASGSCANNTQCTLNNDTLQTCGTHSFYINCTHTENSNVSDTYDMFWVPSPVMTLPANRSYNATDEPLNFTMTVNCSANQSLVSFDGYNHTASNSSTTYWYLNTSRYWGDLWYRGWFETSNGTWYPTGWYVLYSKKSLNFTTNITFASNLSAFTAFTDYVEDFYDDYMPQVLSVLAYGFAFLLTRKYPPTLIAGGIGMVVISFLSGDSTFAIAGALSVVLGYGYKQVVG